MKINLIAVVLAASTSAVSISAYASKDSVPQGKPFQLLQNQINADRELIIANQDAISDLNNSLSTVISDVGLIKVDLNELTSKVKSNSDNINSTQMQLNDLTVVTKALAYDLRVLSTQHRRDTNLLIQMLYQHRSQIYYLKYRVSDLGRVVQQKYSALRQAINENSIAIDDLQFDLADAQSKLAVAIADVAGLEANVSVLEGDIADQNKLLDEVDLRLGALEVEVFGTQLTLIEFETLATCGQETFTWTLNGVSVASDVPPARRCTCNAQIEKLTSTDTELLSAWAGDSNTIGFSKTAGSSRTAFAWTRMILTDVNGIKREECLYDYNGGDCSVTNLCSANFTFSPVDVEVIISGN